MSWSPWSNPPSGRDGATYNNPTITGTVTLTQVPNIVQVIGKSGIPFIHTSSGSIGNNGALTGVTALAGTYSSGAWCYFPANAIAAGVAAGWYWTVFSSTTAGTIYNSTYTGGPVGLGTTTAFATTGPGAYTGETAEVTGPTITLTGGSMGANGVVRVTFGTTMTNNANTKTPRVKFGGNQVSGFNVASQATNQSLIEIHNRGLTNSQATFTQGSTVALSSVAYTSTATASDAAVAITLAKATATDNLVIEGFTFQLVYGS